MAYQFNSTSRKYALPYVLAIKPGYKKTLTSFTRLFHFHNKKFLANNYSKQLKTLPDQ